MIKHLTVLSFLFFTFSTLAQIIDDRPTNLSNRDGYMQADSTKIGEGETLIKLSEETFYHDYKIIDYKMDTTYIDTSLTVSKSYKMNYLRKDNFELMAFANQGQTFNNLAYTFNNYSLYPKIGARAQHFNYYEVEDIKYYYVPTPTTELMYLKGFEQGQILSAMFTFNLSRQFNASISYKGMRSLGNYRHALSSHGNARVTLSYHTKNNRYYIRGHLAAQGLSNDQNGGLTDESVFNFETKDTNFKDRNRLVTNFTDARNNLKGNRYFIEQDYKLWRKTDTTRIINSELKIGYIFNYEGKHYEYEQDAAANEIFGGSFSSSIDDKVLYVKYFNEAFVSLNSPFVLGEVKFKVNFFDYNYSYKSIVISPDEIIPSYLDGNAISVGGEWQTKLKKFNFNADVSTVISGNLHGYSGLASAQFVQDSTFTVKATAFATSKAPNFNFMLFQSDYIQYNWQNNFDNIITNNLTVEFDSEKWVYVSVQTTNITNYTYFDAPEENEQTKPVQASEAVNYAKFKVGKEFKFGHFAFDNKIIYQKVVNGSDIFRVPDFITRNTIYYQNYVFKGKPLYLQTGITFSYFSKYFMNTYNPVISEFNLQNDREYGAFPMIDFFLNFRVKTLRVFLKLEHFNASFASKSEYYGAPLNPYRDMKIRFGLVWNFFI